jgi:putative ABC transport system substrate-binding protein
MVDRRSFIAGSVAALAAPVFVEAKLPGKPVRVAIVGSMTADINAALEESLVRSVSAGGWKVSVERPAFYSTPEQAAAVATAVVRSRPDVVVVWGTVGAVAVKETGTQIPVVFLSVGVPVEIGLVASLARPGGNMTGVTFEAATETYPKRLQLLKELVSTLVRTAVLFAAGDPNVAHARTSLEAAAPALGVQLHFVEARSGDDLATAFSTAKAQRAEGIVVVGGALTFVNGRKIAELALANRLPSSHAFRETVEAGGLVSLGPSYHDMAAQGAAYVAKILRGTKPAALPIEQPTRFETSINLKTAKALGLTIPQSLLLRADRVIE